MVLSKKGYFSVQKSPSMQFILKYSSKLNNFFHLLFLLINSIIYSMLLSGIESEIYPNFNSVF